MGPIARGGAPLARAAAVALVLSVHHEIRAATTLFPVGFFSFEAGGPVRHLAIADLNADGYTDVVAATSASTVTVLLGRSNGMLKLRGTLQRAGLPSEVAVADLNGDGRQDLVVANSGWNTVAVRLGLGDGTLGRARDFRTGIRPAALAIADFNGDARLDVAVANAGSGDVSVLLGRGDGTFAARRDVQIGASSLVSIVAGDLIGDRHVDLAVASADGTPAEASRGRITILAGSADGLIEPSNIDLEFAPRALASGDLNGDGRADVAVAKWGSNDAAVLFGSGAPSPPLDLDAGAAPIAIAIGDVNRDDLNDLAVATAAGVAVRFGNGDGTFTARADFAAGASPASLAIADVNDDGSPDLAVGALEGISVLFGRGNGSFGDPRTHVATGGDGAAVIAVGDLNGDSRPDLVTGNSGTTPEAATISVLIGRWNGRFGARTDYPTGADVPPSSLALGDLNADGALDVVTQGAILLGNGRGGLRDATRAAIGGHVALGDLDRDGHLDVVTSESTGLWVHRGLGDGSLAEAQSVQSGRFGPCALADLDGDGALDVVAASGVSRSGGAAFDDRVWVLLGRGDGTFGIEHPLFVAPGPLSLVVRDVNTDGRLDVAIAAQSGVSMLFGRGDGTFESRRDLELGALAGFVAQDLNGDGKIDLAGTRRAGNVFSFAFGNGDGTFGPRLDGGPGGGNLVATDLDLDGLTDLAIAVRGGISLLVNSADLIPVPVLELQAARSETGARLTWSLTHDLVQALVGVRVQRAAQEIGPWEERSTAPLEPAVHMRFDDAGLENESTWYRLVLVSRDGSLGVTRSIEVTTSRGGPIRTGLHAARETAGGPVQLRYSIAEAAVPVWLDIYDVRGTRLRSFAPEARAPGEYRVDWDRRDAGGARAARGVYVARLRAGGVEATRKIVLVRP